MRSVAFSVLLASFGGLASAAASAGCSNTNTTVPVREDRHTAILAANTSRSYMFWLPPKYDPTVPAPVIISYHGIGQSPTKQANLDWFASPKNNNNSIIIYPQAVIPPGEREVMFQGPRTATEDDITFTVQIIDEIEELYCVDTERIYATGKSEGGGFVGMLACNATTAPLFAAFAPVSGAFYPGNNDGSTDNCVDPPTITCDTPRCNTPFLEFHGGADFLAPIDGGLHRHECLPDIPTYMSEWAARDGLDTEPVLAYNLSSVAGVYKYDDAGTVTWVYDGPKVGHDWPWSVPNPDTMRGHDDPATFNATTFIMEWFGNFSLP
jgi:poly(3-hydroxybutyrate) depolymerase